MSVQKALQHLEEANIAGFFEEIDKLSLPSGQKPLYAQLKQRFVGGYAGFDFISQLKVFAGSIRVANTPVVEVKKPEASVPSTVQVSAPQTPVSTKTIKIFLASSLELKADRDALRLFISVENDRLHEQGIYLKLVQWEHFLDAISETRLQDEYNRAMLSCDVVLSLFFTKVGKYTEEEFDKALEQFKATGKPRIFTYFKNANINTGEINDNILSLLQFKKKLGNLDHFPSHYSNIEDLQLQFKKQLERLLPQL
jgi:hypothetical protein